MRPASFVTLTYPIEDLARHVAEPRLHKRHMQTFWKAVERTYPEVWALWVLEYQRNGNPHLHLLLHWGTRSGTWFDVRRWVASTWSAIVADGREAGDAAAVEEKHRRVGTAVDPLITGDALARYVTKAGNGRPPTIPIGVAAAGELAKRAQKSVRIPGQGRWWGVLGRARYQAASVRIEIQLPEKMSWRLLVGLCDHWKTFFEKQGKTTGAADADVPYLPQWMTAMQAEAVMRKLDMEGCLWMRPGVDLATGEIWQPTTELEENKSA